MFRPNGPPTYPQNMPYQQSQSPQTPVPFHPQQQQQQQFSAQFQTPAQQYAPPGSFYQSPQQRDHPRPPYQVPVQPQPQQFYQSPNPSFDQSPKPAYPPPIQNFESSPNRPYPPPSPGYNQCPPPLQNFNQPPPIQNFNQPPPPPIQNFNQPPPIQNYNQPPPAQNFNQSSPVQNYSRPPIQNYNKPPIQNFNQSVTPPYQPVNQNCRQPMSSPYQSPTPGYGPPPNTPPYQPQVKGPEPLKQPHQMPVAQCYQQRPVFNSPRHDFNQSRPSFRSQGPQRFPFNNPRPRHQQPQHDNTRFQFQPRQHYQNYRPRGPGFNNYHQHDSANHSNGISKKDKPLVACEMGDCDFVGHASAVKEHQNMHHRLGLHKKVLYSNNSDAVKNWIEERKKKWPTKEIIQTKLELEDEKIKRGERIVDEDFHRFNKNNKFNRSGPGRFNNRNRPRFNNDNLEPPEEPMNGKLNRFAGIKDLQNEDEKSEETNKPSGLKLLEEYEASSDNDSDNEPPEETAIVKESAPSENTKVKESESLDNKSLIEHDKEISSYLEEEDSMKHDEELVSSSLVVNGDEIVNTEVAAESCSKESEECEKKVSEPGQKRKKHNKNESKPAKKVPPPRTPRNEVLEKKAALIEALMGDLMRSERNAITQCICFIRNNMHRFCKIQAA